MRPPLPAACLLVLALTASAGAAPPAPPTPAAPPAPPVGPAASAAAAASAAVARSVEGQGAPGNLDVLFTSDLEGRFAWPGCGPTRPQGHADLSHLITASRLRREAARRAGGDDPLVLGGGSMLRPDVLGAHVFGEGAAWAPRAVDLLRAVGFKAVSLGRYDFNSTPSSLALYLRLMRQAGIAVLASNVRCSDPKDFRCRGLGWAGQPYYLHQGRHLRVGVLSVVREDLVRRLDASRAGSLIVDEPAAVARRLIRKLRREERVDLVVLLASVNLESDTPQPVIALTRRLGADTPDLIVADAMFDPESQAFIDYARVHDGPPITGTDRFGQHLGQASFRFRHRRGALTLERPQISVSSARKVAPDEGAVPLVQDLLGELCRSLSTPLGRAHLRSPLDRDGFIRYVLEILRKRTGAEVAVLNDSAVPDTTFPMRGRLTREKLLRALRNETRVGTLRVSGDRLLSLLGGYADGGASALRVLGLEKVAGSWYVNSRPVMTSHHYLVATTSFVARGGEGLLALSTESFRRSWFTLRRGVIDFFDGDGQAALDRDPDVDLRKDFRDPWDRWLFWGSTDLGVSLATLSVWNGDDGNRYSLPPLKRASVTSVNARLTLSGGASTRHHALEADLSLQYGETWTRAAGATSTTAAETLDKIQGNFLYRLPLLKNLRGLGAWYIPVPYAEGYLISEFTPSGSYTDPATGVTQTYHYLDLGGTVGAGLGLQPGLFFKTGFALRGEALSPGPEHALRAGLYLGYTLRRMTLVASARFPLQAESRLDFFLTDLGASLRRELTLDSRLSFGLKPPLFVTLTHRLYVFDDRDHPTSLANDLGVGLEVFLDHRYQTR